MNLNPLMLNEKNLAYFFFILIICSYFFGFYYLENSAGGAIVDFENTKRNIITFKNNSFLDAIKLTTTTDNKIFQSTRAPGYYVFNKYFNPFTTEIRLFQLYITIFSLLIPILFFFNLILKFNQTPKHRLILLSSIIFLSPYFRSSAFWGNEENFGITMVGFSALFLQLYLGSKKNEILFLFFLALFSSACVYSDQKLIIIPFISLIFVFFSNKKTKDKITLLILYFILSIPFIFLIKLWGNIVPPGDAERRRINARLLVNLNFHHILFAISIISFYLFPLIFFLKNKAILFKEAINSKINIILTFLFLLLLFNFIFFFEINEMYTLGGGVFRKFTQSIFNNLIAQKFMFALIFIVSWILILIFCNNNKLNYLTLLSLPVFSIIVSPALFQEYFDPLVFFLIFIYLKFDYEFKFKKILFQNIYYLIFLCISFVYYNFFL